MDYLNIETATIVLTQFKPINSNRRTKEQNDYYDELWEEYYSSRL